MKQIPPFRHNNSQQKGMALILALFTVLIVAFLATEITKETVLEYQISNSEIKRIRAYYAAKSGVDISLLRIQLYQTILAHFGKQIGDNSHIADLIWNFPFTWPITLPDELNEVDKSEINALTSESFFGTNTGYLSTIESEAGKIDINDLVSLSAPLAKATRSSLKQLIENQLNTNQDFEAKHQNLNVDELLDNIKDWIDEDDQAEQGGLESQMYDNTDGELNLNRPFKTLKELKMVSGMTPELFEFLSSQVTIYGLKGININKATKEVLQSIDIQITDEIADEILTHRSDPDIGPFKNKKGFFDYLQSIGINTENFNPDEVPLYYQRDYNFKIKSIGFHGKSNKYTREIIAIVYDFDTVKKRLEKLVKTTTTTMIKTPTTLKSGAPVTSTTTTTTLKPVKKTYGKPRIIYWYEN